MAITKLLRIKESRSGDPGGGLRRCVNYICNEDKTENRALVTGNAGNIPEAVYIMCMSCLQ